MPTRRLVTGVVAVAAVLLGGRALSVIYDSFSWYESLGAGSVWMEHALDSSLVTGLGFVLAMAFTLSNLAVVVRGIGTFTRPRRLANVEFGEEVPRVQLKLAAVAVSAIVAVALLRLLPSWKTVAMAKLGVDFGEADPYLNHDLSFFVTWLPLERAVYSWAMALVITVSALVIALYVFASGVSWRGAELRITARARRHLGILAALLLLVCTWSYRLDSYELLSGGGHDSSAFGYFDHKWMLAGLLALSLATAATAITVVISAWMGQLRTSLIALMVAIGLAAVVQEIVPFVYHRSTSEREARREDAPYVATRADFTRRAFGAELEASGERASPFTSLPTVSPSVVRTGDTLVAPGALGTRVVDDPTIDIAAPSLGNGVTRLAHAWATRDFGLLADSLHRRARIVTVRDVRERVQRLYPLFFVGQSLRPLFRADTLFWSLPLYTTATTYPLAEKREILGEARSYFHRAGTALVNARTGRVAAALDLPPEPIAAGWIRRFATPSSLAAAQTLQHSLSINTAGASNAPSSSDTSFRAGVIRLYDRMRSALSAGDLRGFGLAYDSLGALVGRGQK